MLPTWAPVATLRGGTAATVACLSRLPVLAVPTALMAPSTRQSSCALQGPTATRLGWPTTRSAHPAPLAPTAVEKVCVWSVLERRGVTCGAFGKKSCKFELLVVNKCVKNEFGNEWMNDWKSEVVNEWMEELLGEENEQRNKICKWIVRCEIAEERMKNHNCGSKYVNKWAIKWMFEMMM